MYRNMDERTLELAKGLISARYVDSGRESLRSTAATLRSLLAQRQCPEKGMSDEQIEYFLHQIALMDTNNFARHVGGGEREGRVLSSLVRRRHFGLSHGIGRSGDLTSEQPKAPGSSLLYQITNFLMLDLIRLAGARSTAAAVVVPMATGMTLSLALRCTANARTRELEEAESSAASPAPRYVIWPRIDQKTCIKCVAATGLVPVPVELRQAPPPLAGYPRSSTAHFLQCDVDDVKAAVQSVGGSGCVVCVLSTTSCFAPRLPDDVVAIARYCEEAGIPHVINNAYGLQSRSIMRKIDAAQRLGRVDFVVQSGDKNFLVPVGGSILTSPRREKCQAASAVYAGRASMSPAMDLCITALSLGRRGFAQLWADRYVCRRRLRDALQAFAQRRRELLLAEDAEVPNGNFREDRAATIATVEGDRSPEDTAAATTRDPQPRNDISFAVTMQHYGMTAEEVVAADDERTEREEAAGERRRRCYAAAQALGARLFRSAVTGPRVVVPQLPPASPTRIAGCSFLNYGMHQDATPPCPMLVLACGIGMTEEEVVQLMERLEELWPVL